jgi:hypothetical protein
MMRRCHLLAAAAAVGAMIQGGCAYQVEYEAGYVPPERPPFVAQGKLLIVLPEEQRSYTYEGPPDSEVGNFTTLTIPVGQMVREISEEIFNSCFAEGLIFADNRFISEPYDIAIEANLQSLLYRYTRIVDTGFDEQNPDVWIVPEVDISFEVLAYDPEGDRLLDKVYESGLVSGEPYMTTSHPAERINETLHATLHELMLELAADLRLLLIGQCEITDLGA